MPREKERRADAAALCTSMSRSYARELAQFLKADGTLVSIERYAEGPAYRGMLLALEEQGLFPTQQQEIICRCGDERTAFQFTIMGR